MERELGIWRMSGGRDIKEENEKRRRRRSLAIAWSLVGFMVLFFLVTVVHLGGNVFKSF